MEPATIRKLVGIFALFMATIFTIMAVSGPKHFAWLSLKFDIGVGERVYLLGLSKTMECNEDGDNCKDPEDYGDCTGDACGCKDAGQVGEGLMGTLLCFQLLAWLTIIIQAANGKMNMLPAGVLQKVFLGLYLFVVVVGFIFAVASVAHWRNECYDYYKDFDSAMGFDDVTLGPGWAVTIVVILFQLAMIPWIIDLFKGDSAVASAPEASTN